MKKKAQLQLKKVQMMKKLDQRHRLHHNKINQLSKRIVKNPKAKVSHKVQKTTL